MTAATVGYAAFLETVPEAAVLVDGAGLVRLANGRARALLGEPLPALPLRPVATTTTLELRLDGARITTRLRTNPVTLDGEVLTLALLSDDRDDERLEQAMQLTGTMGFFDHDQVNDRLYVSGAYRAVAGYGPDEEVTVPSLFERVHPEDRPRLLEAIGRAHHPAGDGTFEIEYRLVRPDGGVRWLLARSRTFFEGTGAARRPVRTVGAGLDVTRRHDEEAEMRTWAQAVEASNSGLAIADLSGRLTYVNPAFVQLWGLPDEAAAVGRSAVEFWADPEGAARVLSGLATQPRWTGDLVGRRADGTTFPVLFSASVIFDAQGRPSNLVGSFVDITQRQQAEAERARLAALLDTTPDVVMVATLGGELVYANRAWRRLRGLADDGPLVGQHFGDGLAPAERERLGAGIAIALKQGAWWGQVTLPVTEGTPPEFSVLAQVHGEGAQRRLSVIGRDVTQQRLLEAQLRQSQKMEAVGRLAGGVAHDFNNLLTVINANAELLLGDPVLPAVLKDDVQMVHNAGLSAAQLTRQLLAFSRKQVLQPVTLDLNELMGHVEKMLRRVIGEDIELVTHRAPGLWATRVDRGQMEQVLVNLAVNARDAMPTGGKLTLETGNVILDAEYAAKHAEVTAGEHVLLAVSDSGVGMEREVLHKVFEPFFTTKGTRGTGLGLSTVYGIVKQSGGHVSVYSEPGRGTTFKLYLPRDLSLPGPAPSPPPPRPSRVEPATVLVVEDSEGVRELVPKYLEARGHTVLTAARGEDALQLVEHHHGPLELLITDVVMPGMGGRALADQLKRTRPSLQVLFMSGYTENAIVHHGVLDAGLDFIAKPFAIDAFGRQVDELLLRRAK